MIILSLLHPSCHYTNHSLLPDWLIVTLTDQASQLEAFFLDFSVADLVSKNLYKTDMNQNGRGLLWNLFSFDKFDKLLLESLQKPQWDEQNQL